MVAVLIVAIGATAFVVNLINPTPAPRVLLQLVDGQVASRPLVTLADGTWYFGGSGHTLRVIEVNDVRSATITPVHNRRDLD